MQSVTTKKEVVERLTELGSELSALGVVSLGLFGSFRHDRATPESDVDFLVAFRPGDKTYQNLFLLNQLLESILGRKVELVTLESLSSKLRIRILEDVEYVKGSIDLPRPHS